MTARIITAGENLLNSLIAALLSSLRLYQTHCLSFPRTDHDSSEKWMMRKDSSFCNISEHIRTLPVTQKPKSCLINQLLSGTRCMWERMHIAIVKDGIHDFSWRTAMEGDRIRQQCSNHRIVETIDVSWLSECIVWSISICPSLTRWDLELAFHGSLFPECKHFGKLNKSNRFRVCNWLYNYFPILYFKIC
jgi:hypothetical protein